MSFRSWIRLSSLSVLGSVWSADLSLMPVPSLSTSQSSLSVQQTIKSQPERSGPAGRQLHHSQHIGSIETWCASRADHCTSSSVRVETRPWAPAVTLIELEEAVVVFESVGHRRPFLDYVSLRLWSREHFFDQSLQTDQQQQSYIAYNPCTWITVYRWFDRQSISCWSTECRLSTLMIVGHSLHRHNIKSAQARNRVSTRTLLEIQWSALDAHHVSIDPMCWLWSSCRPAGPDRSGFDLMVCCTDNDDRDVDKDGTGMSDTSALHTDPKTDKEDRRSYDLKLKAFFKILVL